jgi:heme a synthase
LNNESNIKFSRLAWAALVYNLAVILWGAWVRITGSGAGCGDHWPTCGGEIIPRSPGVETIIEFSHRLTSGLTLIFGIILVVIARRVFAKGHRARTAAWVTLVFILLEAALGAILVLKGLVAKDTSSVRAVVVALHLVNTLGLVGGGALTAWWSVERPRSFGTGVRRGSLLALVTGLVLVGATGAITALGDTLFPVPVVEGSGLIATIVNDISMAQHILVRLRIVHPLLALCVGLGILVWGLSVERTTQSGALGYLANALVWSTALQMMLGVLNVILHAPGWMQLVHLLVADLVWVAAILTCVEAKDQNIIQPVSS